MATQTIGHAQSTLSRRRRELGWSRERLGARAGGVSSSTIKRIERHEVVPHPSTVAALAGALGCAPEDLLAPAEANV
jgi:transcriptional regulator with XRE-family HTH domain